MSPQKNRAWETLREHGHTSKWQLPSTCLKSIAEICGRQLFFSAFKPTGGSAEVKISRGKTDPRSINPYIHWPGTVPNVPVPWMGTIHVLLACTFYLKLQFHNLVKQVCNSSMLVALQKSMGHTVTLNQMYLVKQAAEWAEDMNNDRPFRGISLQQSAWAAAMAPGSTVIQTETVNKKWAPKYLGQHWTM